ncbi:MAG: metal-dependent hydrolase [Peptococcaceae bacterium]|nr:metal-dependent hydrolase [Peptococcaceae bacterium]
MLWRTHVLGGAAAGLLVSEPSAAISAMAVGAAAALLPDIDSPFSQVGRRVFPAAWILKLTVGHRGVFHSVLAAAVVAAASCFIPTDILPPALMMKAVFAGYLSHILLDSLSGGTYAFYPLPARVGVSLVSTGGFLEKIVLSPALLIAVCWLAVVRKMYLL